MKVAAGMFYHEANSFNPNQLRKDELVYCEGQEVLNRLYATPVFQAAGVELVPLIYAVALPGGIMSKACYDSCADRILELLSQNRDVDGVFLHLHGACEVAELGSGELDLLTRIREMLGKDVYIGIAMDFHASNAPGMPALANVIRNYRTVPHSDQPETEKAVAGQMLNCMRRGDHTVPQYARVPFTAGGEKAMGTTWPLSHLFERLNELEKEEEIAIASMALGMAWCDAKALSASVIITPSKSEYAAYASRKAAELADDIYSLRDDFDFEQLPLNPHDAVRYAMRFEYGAPVYVSDSGDNTTGGAVGDHTVMLREFLKLRTYNAKRVLVTAIWDESAVEQTWSHAEGETITLSVGKDYDENTRAVTVTGVLKKKGSLLGYMGCEDDATGRCVTIRTPHVDFCVIDHPGSFISKAHFGAKGAGLNMEDYQVIVVKQGYLFPQLRELAKLSILALTPGATHQIIESLEYKKIVPPVYPLHYVGK
ncbi:MAG: M81 family metallopeptidase [Clostridia bacterium]